MSRTLTLHQPWATLIALGIKTIETRSWSTDYRGPLLIHAGLTKAPVRGVPWDPHDVRPLPLGAIVASCTLADVVPMVENATAPTLAGTLTLDMPDQGPGLPAGLWLIPSDYKGPRCVEDQRPYGVFAPGRFAWLLEDVQATTGRCPSCWGSGVVNVGVGVGQCPTCDGKGSCDPIPAKGKQRLWKWTP